MRQRGSRPLAEQLARSVIDNLHRFVVPNIAGPARLVPLRSLDDGDVTYEALRQAARRGRLIAHQVSAACGEPTASPCSNTRRPVSVTQRGRVDNAIPASRRQSFVHFPMAENRADSEDDPCGGPQMAWKLRTLATR